MRPLALIVLFVLSLSVVACNERTVSVDEEASFKMSDVSKGSGLLVQEGSVITTHYTVTLPDGTVIIDTRADGRSHTFKIGDGTVVQGMDELVRGMRVGGTRRAIIPPSLHYGSAGHGGVIPPGASLEFRVTIVDARTG